MNERDASSSDEVRSPGRDAPSTSDSVQRETPLLELTGITKRFATPADLSTRIADRLRGRHEPRVVHAIDGVDMSLMRGEVVGLVGESGCGKSTLGRIVAGLHAPTSGTRRWQGELVVATSSGSFSGSLSDSLSGSLSGASPGASRRRGQLAIQMIFQDPSASLNPRLRVFDLIAEAPIVHGLWSRAEARTKAIALMERVGLGEDALSRYAHQFSGGQRARIGIARALAVEPELLVCDEAVAALDVSTQAQVLNLFMDLRDETISGVDVQASAGLGSMNASPYASAGSGTVHAMAQTSAGPGAINASPHASAGSGAINALPHASAGSGAMNALPHASAGSGAMNALPHANERAPARAAVGLTYLFISHDLAVVQHLSDRVLIMYLGRIVESASTTSLFDAPNHPYTQALLAETPTLALGKRRFTTIEGEVPSPLTPPGGCHFHPRCPRRSEVPGDRCARERPVLRVVDAGHASACHLNDR